MGNCSNTWRGVGEPGLIVAGMDRNYHIFNLYVFLTKSICPVLAIYYTDSLSLNYSPSIIITRVCESTRLNWLQNSSSFEYTDPVLGRSNIFPLQQSQKSCNWDEENRVLFQDQAAHPLSPVGLSALETPKMTLTLLGGADHQDPFSLKLKSLTQ